MNTSDISKYKIIFFFLKGYFPIALCVFISSLGFAIFESINVASIFPVVSSILTSSGQFENYGRIIVILYRVIQFFPFKDLFISSCILLIISTFLKFTTYLLFTYFSYKLSLTARSNLQNEIFKKILNSDCQYFVDNKQGTILYRLLNAPINVGTTLKLIPDIFIQSIKILFLLILLFSMSGKLFIALLIIGTVFALLIKYLSNKSYGFGKEVVHSAQDQNSIINESITGIRQIIIYLCQKMWMDKFREKIAQYYRHKFASQLLTIIPTIAFEPLIILLVCGTGIILRLRYEINFLEVLPVLTIYAFAIIRISPSLTQVGQQKMQIMNIFPDLEICYSVLNSNTNSINDGSQICESFKNEISFDDISFSYPNRSTVFKNLSITIIKGESTAIVGESGIGKSTLMDLLVRLYDPDYGKIKIDDIDLKNIKISSWRNKIGYVSQEAFMINATISENIAFSKNKYNMKEIVEAAKIANAHDFICEFPEAYETIVGDRGVKLSGGQKQRIAIARAIIRKPEIIIFDEATSALDNISERIVQEAIEKILKEYTVIIIAHRLSTIQNADKIIVLGNKKIKEEGNHQKLLDLKGKYWTMYNKEYQSGHNL